MDVMGFGGSFRVGVAFFSGRGRDTLGSLSRHALACASASSSSVQVYDRTYRGDGRQWGMTNGAEMLFCCVFLALVTK